MNAMAGCSMLIWCVGDYAVLLSYIYVNRITSNFISILVDNLYVFQQNPIGCDTNFRGRGKIAGKRKEETWMAKKCARDGMV